MCMCNNVWVLCAYVPDSGVVMGTDAGEPVGRFNGGLHGADAEARADQ